MHHHSEATIRPQKILEVISSSEDLLLVVLKSSRLISSIYSVEIIAVPTTFLNSNYSFYDSPPRELIF